MAAHEDRRDEGADVQVPGIPEPRESAGEVTVQRVGTQVVVRLYGHLDDRTAGCLADAMADVESMVLSRVVVDLDEVDSIEGAGLDFIVGLHRRWKVRLLNTPNQLRGRIPRLATVRPLEG
jgi:ABC-type transporter Mla MlaB component